MRFFRSPEDLVAWVKKCGSAEKAAKILVNLPKVGEDKVSDVVETTKRITEASDKNAANVLYSILRTAGVADDDVKKVEDGIDKVEVADEMLRRKLVSTDEHNKLIKEAQIMRQPGEYDMPLRVCPKLPWSVGKKLISTYNCRHYCLDGVVLDDDPMRVYCGELLWRRHVADKFSSDYQDRKTGELVGGYINERFYKFPDAGTPDNPGTPRDGGNPMELKPGERTRQPRPHQWSVERRMQEAREKKSTSDIVLNKTASTRTAGWSGKFDLESRMDSRLMDYWQKMPEGNAKDIFSDAVSDATEDVMKTGMDFNRSLVIELNKMANDPEYAEMGIGTVVMDVKRIMSAKTASSWLGRAVEAQVNIEEVNKETSATGYITKNIKGVEFDIEWRYFETGEVGQVEFEWPRDAMNMTGPSESDGTVVNPQTGEILIDGAAREDLETQWNDEVVEAIFNPSRAASTSSVRVVEAKKKGKPVNPWAVCHTTVDKDEDPEKYERCVKDVKKDHPVKESSEDTAKKVIMATNQDDFVKISSDVVKATSGDSDVVTAFSMAVDLDNEQVDSKDAVLRISEATGMTIESASRIYSVAVKKMAAHVSDVYKADVKDEVDGDEDDEVASPDVQKSALETGLVEE